MPYRPVKKRILREESPEREGHLRPGMTVLDVGCGPGTISLDVKAFGRV